MIVKYRSNEMELLEGDRILDNGACYQVVTRTPTFLMHTARTKKLIKEGRLILAEGKYKSRFLGCKYELDLYKLKVGD